MNDQRDAVAGVDEPSENSPLKRTELSIENEADAPSGLRSCLAKSKVKWLIAILVVIVLLAVALVTTLLLLDTSTKLLKLWPRPNEPGDVISFVYGSGRDWAHLTEQLNELFTEYHIDEYQSDVVHCQNGIQIEEDEVCYFDIEPILSSGCSYANNYGYDLGSPCIILQFNKITNWVPEPYTARELENYMKFSTAADLVYLDCQGDTSADKQNAGPIEYTPVHGFQTKYFPYRGQEHYMSPIVAIRFRRPATGVVISITCKLWAKNVEHTDGVPNDQISFYLLVD